MITINLFVNNETAFQELKQTFQDGFADTIATIENGEIMYEFYMEDGRLTCYECKYIGKEEYYDCIQEDSKTNCYQTVDAIDVSYVIQESDFLEEFVTQVLRFML